MPRTLQFKRYANTALTALTGSDGELILDKTNHTVTVHDGVTVGGTRLATESFAISQANAASQVEPQNPQSTNYVLTNADAGKHIYYTNSANVNLYIPWTANTTYANGTYIRIVSHSTSNVVVTPNASVSLYSTGNTTSGNHNVTSYGVATLMMVAANTWYIYGFGVN